MSDLQHQEILQHYPLYRYENPFVVATRDSRLAGLDAPRLASAIDEALIHNFNACNHNLPIKADHIYEALQRVDAGKPSRPVVPPTLRIPDPASGAKEPRNLRQIQEQQRRGAQKAMGGMTLLLAAFSGLQAFRGYSQIHTKDAEGKDVTQWSQVGLAVLNTALAAGLAYAGAQQMQGRSVF